MSATTSTHVELLRSLGLVIGEPERVLICTHESCGYALQVHDIRVSRHLYEKHKIPKASRRGLDRIVASLGLCDPRSVNPRANRSVPHPLLQVSPGFVCRRCGNLTISSKLHQQNRCASGQSANIEDGSGYDDLDEEVLLQSWVEEGRRPYWIVKREEPSNESSPSDGLTNQATNHHILSSFAKPSELAWRNSGRLPPPTANQFTTTLAKHALVLPPNG